jgi:Glycosyltransferase family 25 (LPS biosynthesis protein)
VSVSSKVSPLIIVIHSNEEDRNSYLTPKINSLATELETNVEFIGEGYRRNFTLINALKYSISTYQISKKSFLNTSKDSSFSTHFKKNIRSIRHAISSLNLSLETREKMYNGISKHFLRWKLFFESESELLIVFENDVCFKDTSNHDLKKVLDILESQEDDKYLYCDIAGGFDPTSILRSELLLKKNNFSINLSQFNEEDSQSRLLIKLPKFVTNTACGYIINKKVAQRAIHAFEKTVVFSIDWYLNKLLYDIEDLSPDILCYYSLPWIF